LRAGGGLFRRGGRRFNRSVTSNIAMQCGEFERTRLDSDDGRRRFVATLFRRLAARFDERNDAQTGNQNDGDTRDDMFSVHLEIGFEIWSELVCAA
jgi:hypothetical protein